MHYIKITVNGRFLGFVLLFFRKEIHVLRITHVKNHAAPLPLMVELNLHNGNDNCLRYLRGTSGYGSGITQPKMLAILPES